MLLYACACGVKSEISQVSNFARHRWFCFQRCCKTFCFICFYLPALCRMCVFVLWTSCLRAKIQYYNMWPFPKKLYHGWISTMASSNEISWKSPPPRNEKLVAPLTILECFSVLYRFLLKRYVYTHRLIPNEFIVHLKSCSLLQICFYLRAPR